MKKLTADEKMRQQLEAREKLQRDMVSAKEMGFQMGLERGMKQGMEQGIKQSIKQTVKNMIKYGEEEEKIIRYIGISKQEMQKIKKEIEKEQIA